MEKTALVIGGSGGIGEAVTRRLSGEGFKVFFTYLSGKDKAEALVRELGEGKAASFQMDVTSEDSVSSAFNAMNRLSPAIDLLVYSVSAPLELKPVLEKKWSSFIRHFEVQLKGLFLALQALQPQIKSKQKLKIIILLTEICFTSPPSQLADYSAAKYALLGFSKSLAAELSRLGVTVNTVSPGLAQTSLIASFPRKLIEMEAEKSALKRLVMPEDVAEAVCALASEKSVHANGENIFVGSAAGS